MYQMTVQLPNLPKGADVVVDGLGTFTNGETYTISEEMDMAYRRHNMTQKFTHNADGRLVAKTELGPTLLEATENNEGLDVTESESDQGYGQDALNFDSEGDDE